MVKKGSRLVLVEAPGLAVLADYQFVGGERLYLDAYVAEGLETKRLFDNGCIEGSAFDGITLDEKTVALTLEIAIHIAFVEALKPGDSA